MALEKVLNGAVVSNFNKLSKMSAEHNLSVKGIPTWSLKYQKDKISGFIHQDGTISCNGAEIQILGHEIKKIKKTFFSTWNSMFLNINKMLENSIENYGTNVVQKRVVRFVVFSEEKIAQLQKSVEKLLNQNK